MRTGWRETLEMLIAVVLQPMRQHTQGFRPGLLGLDRCFQSQLCLLHLSLVSPLCVSETQSPHLHVKSENTFLVHSL